MYESIEWLTQPIEPIDDHYMPEPLPDPIEKVNDYYNNEFPPPEPYFPQFEDWGFGPGGW